MKDRRNATRLRRRLLLFAAPALLWIPTSAQSDGPRAFCLSQPVELGQGLGNYLSERACTGFDSGYKVLLGGDCDGVPGPC